MELDNSISIREKVDDKDNHNTNNVNNVNKAETETKNQPSDDNTSKINGISDENLNTLVSGSSVLDERSVNGYDYLLKIIVVGNSCVGKSNLTLRFTRDDFEIENETTIGVEFATRLVCLDSKVYKLQIWDTAGQDTFKTITRSYYRNSIGVIVAYDITNRESFDAVREWNSEVQERSQPYTGLQCIMLIGNKTDRTNERQVLTSEGENLASELGVKFFEASAKTGENVKDIFCHIVADINQKIKSGKLEFNKSESVSLVPTENLNTDRSYCNC